MDDDCQRCGHDRELHVDLPGYPGGAVECWGTDDCGCGRFVEPEEDRSGGPPAALLGVGGDGADG